MPSNYAGRSPSGWPYRSPGGVLARPGVAAPDLGFVEYIPRATSLSYVLVDTSSSCRLQYSSGSGADSLNFTFDADLGYTDDQLYYGTYTGLTSGAVWTYGNWGLRGLYCTGDLYNRLYTMGGVAEPFPGNPGVAISSEYAWFHRTVGAGVAVGGDVNYGFFPAAIRPPAFFGLERFSFVPGTAP